MDSSEFYRFLADRSSVRVYDTRPVAPEDLDYLIRCASTAPSAGNLEAWGVVAVTDPGIRSALSAAALHQGHIAQAPLILVVCGDIPRSRARYGERARLYAVQDATIAATYLMLSAEIRGLRSCWTGAFDEKRVQEILSLPGPVRPIVLLAVGYGAAPVTATGRMSPQNHLHRETW